MKEWRSRRTTGQPNEQRNFLRQSDDQINTESRLKFKIINVEYMRYWSMIVFIDFGFSQFDICEKIEDTLASITNSSKRLKKL